MTMVSECLARVMSSASFSRLAAAEYMVPDPVRQHATELRSYAAAVVQNCAVGGDAGESRQVDSREGRMIIAKHNGGRIVRRVHEAVCREEARASYLVGGHYCIPGGDRDARPALANMLCERERHAAPDIVHRRYALEGDASQGDALSSGIPRQMLGETIGDQRNGRRLGRHHPIKQRADAEGNAGGQQSNILK